MIKVLVLLSAITISAYSADKFAPQILVSYDTEQKLSHTEFIVEMSVDKIAEDTMVMPIFFNAGFIAMINDVNGPSILFQNFGEECNIDWRSDRVFTELHGSMIKSQCIDKEMCRWNEKEKISFHLKATQYDMLST